MSKREADESPEQPSSDPPSAKLMSLSNVDLLPLVHILGFVDVELILVLAMTCKKFCALSFTMQDRLGDEVAYLREFIVRMRQGWGWADLFGDACRHGYVGTLRLFKARSGHWQEANTSRGIALCLASGHTDAADWLFEQRDYLHRDDVFEHDAFDLMLRLPTAGSLEWLRAKHKSYGHLIRDRCMQFIHCVKMSPAVHDWCAEHIDQFRPLTATGGTLRELMRARNYTLMQHLLANASKETCIAVLPHLHLHHHWREIPVPTMTFLVDKCGKQAFKNQLPKMVAQVMQAKNWDLARLLHKLFGCIPPDVIARRPSDWAIFYAFNNGLDEAPKGPEEPESPRSP